MQWWELVLTHSGIAVLSFLVGRWLERLRILDKLLKSSDPENWTAAHRVHNPKRASKDEDDDSDIYPPTPTRLPIVNPLKETIKVEDKTRKPS